MNSGDRCIITVEGRIWYQVSHLETILDSCHVREQGKSGTTWQNVLLSKSLRSAQNRGVDKSEYMVREEKVRGREGNSTRVVSTFSELQSARLCHLYLDLCTHTSTCTRVNGVWLFDNDRLHVPSKLVQIFATFNSERKSPSTLVFKQLRSEFEQFCCSASSH